MPNYAEGSNGGTIVYLTAKDLVEGMQGTPLDLDESVEKVALTKDAGEMLDELTGHQKHGYMDVWEDK